MAIQNAVSALFLVVCAASTADTITPTSDADVSLNCSCVASTAACQSKVLDAVAGAQRVTWSQPIHLTAGVPADLNAACYRKRNVSSGGNGLCCETDDSAQTAQKLFLGTINAN